MPHSRKSKHQPKKQNKVLTSLLVATGVIMFWRGVWGILDMHFIPGNPTISNTLSILVGILILYSTHYLVKELL